jgi:predicted dehydrogenase
MKNILVCGYGSIGRKHALNLKTLGASVHVWRKRDKTDDIIADGFTPAPDLDSAIAACDAVIIATATDEHIDIALRAARARKAIYLEKPLSHNNDGVADLLNAAEGLTIEIGCQLRHHPNIQYLRPRLASGADGKILTFNAWVGQRLDQWRPGTDYRTGYSADAARGGGALFDLVHEIDLINWLAGPVTHVSADLRHNGPLDMKGEDLANLILTTQNGASGVVQLDMLSPAYRRGFTLVCENAVYSWNYNTGILTRDDGTGPVTAHAAPDGFAPRDLLMLSMKHFMARLDDPSLPTSCSLPEAAHDLAILLAARRSSAAGKRESVL